MAAPVRWWRIATLLVALAACGVAQPTTQHKRGSNAHAASGSQCAGGGSRDPCVGYDPLVRSRKICEVDLHCCWVPERGECNAPSARQDALPTREPGDRIEDPGLQEAVQELNDQGTADTGTKGPEPEALTYVPGRSGSGPVTPSPDAQAQSEQLASKQYDERVQKTNEEARRASSAPISRAMILERAMVWVRSNVAYRPGQFVSETLDGRGEQYRMDSSGLVSMAWRLHQSRTADTLEHDAPCTRVMTAEAKIGDALVVPGHHTALFAGWVEGSEKGRYKVIENVSRALGTVLRERVTPGLHGRDVNVFVCRFALAEGVEPRQPGLVAGDRGTSADTEVDSEALQPNKKEPDSPPTGTVQEPGPQKQPAADTADSSTTDGEEPDTDSVPKSDSASASTDTAGTQTATTRPPPAAPAAPSGENDEFEDNSGSTAGTTTASDSSPAGSGGPPPAGSGCAYKSASSYSLDRRGYDFLKDVEGHGNFHCYRDSANVWTIGYGHACNNDDGDPDCNSCRAKGTAHIVSSARAEALLKQDVRKFEACVRKTVTVPITQNQFDVLVSFTFNLGCEGGGMSPTDSTLRRKLNKGLYREIPAQLVRWNKAGGRADRGLTARRQKEVDLWNAGACDGTPEPSTPTDTGPGTSDSGSGSSRTEPIPTPSPRPSSSSASDDSGNSNSGPNDSPPSPPKPGRPGTATSAGGNCGLVVWTHGSVTSLHSNRPICVSPKFVPQMDTIGRLAEEHGVGVTVVSASRQNAKVKGAIVTPAKHSNHMSGSAVDVNIVSPTGEVCTSSCLGNIRSADPAIQKFVAALKRAGLRWGQDFRDPVHFDDSLNRRDADWKKQYAEVQEAYASGCASKTLKCP